MDIRALLSPILLKKFKKRKAGEATRTHYRSLMTKIINNTLTIDWWPAIDRDRTIDSRLTDYQNTRKTIYSEGRGSICASFIAIYLTYNAIYSSLKIVDASSLIEDFCETHLSLTISFRFVLHPYNKTYAIPHFPFIIPHSYF